MTTDDCTNMDFLLQADVDGALDIGATASLAAHLAQCPACQTKQAALRQLSSRLRTELPYHAAPDRLRRSLEAALAAAPQALHPLPRRLTPASFRVAGWMRRLIPLGASAALAAGIVLAVVLPRGDDVTDSVVASHIRALQPGHLSDVISTDQHTVKPWFDGRLNYAPPVKDLSAQGFPLIGGRLDYLAGRAVAALGYRRAQHIIDLYVWPSSSHIDTPPGTGERNGYNFVRWTQDEMVFWAVSDLNRPELDDFVQRWRQIP